MLGTSEQPRRLPPDGAKKIIQFTKVEDLCYIPTRELHDVSNTEAAGRLSPGRVEDGCPACRAPFASLFFFVRGLHRTAGDTVHARCQECFEPMFIDGDGLCWY